MVLPSSFTEKTKEAVSDLSDQLLLFAQKRLKERIDEIVDDDDTVADMNQKIEEEYGSFKGLVEDALDPSSITPEEVLIFLGENLDEIDFKKYFN